MNGAIFPVGVAYGGAVAGGAAVASAVVGGAVVAAAVVGEVVAEVVGVGAEERGVFLFGTAVGMLLSTACMTPLQA